MAVWQVTERGNGPTDEARPFGIDDAGRRNNEPAPACAQASHIGMVPDFGGEQLGEDEVARFRGAFYAIDDD
ncbi:MAG: hypothetical protein ACE5E6_02985 [Phycisphaerae bacterium]